MKTAIERRRFRRAELDVPVTLRPLGTEEAAEMAITGQVKNLSLAGVYCHVTAPCLLRPGNHVTCSISIPLEQARWFPFSRVQGKGWVVRVEPVPMGRREGEQPPEEELLGVAVAFMPDVTALGTIG